MSRFDELFGACLDNVARPGFDWMAVWVDVGCMTCGVAREDARHPAIASVLIDLDRAYHYRDVDAFMNLKDFVLPRILKGEWQHDRHQRA